jgi:hypothetical protein
MGEVLPLPHRGEIFLDPRGEGRSLRISGHPDAATVVLSIWDHGQCRATFRLPAGQVDALLRAVLIAAPPPAPDADVWRVDALAPSADAGTRAVETPAVETPALETPSSDAPAADARTTETTETVADRTPSAEDAGPAS